MIINTRIGKLYASIIKEETKDVYQILSIPYARAERFEKPQQIENYPEGEIINRRESVCFPQRRIPKFLTGLFKNPLVRPEFMVNDDIQTEDAFVVNIWTSGLDDKKPVLVFIHGGGDNGSGTVPIYNGSHIAAKDIVVVTMNYRFGILGGLPVYDENRLNANRGALDQQAALAWIRNNIYHFGGDSKNITLMGQSRGALSSLNQFLNPISNKLFDKLIICAALPVPIVGEDGLKEDFEYTLVKNGLSDFNELKNLPIRKLRRLKVKNIVNEVIDGAFYKKNPREVFINGEFPSKPMLIGTNADEFTMFYMPIIFNRLGIVKNKEKLDDALQDRYGKYGEIMRNALEPESKDLVDLQMKIMEMVAFHSVAFNLLEKFSTSSPVYGYRMSYVPNVYGGIRGAYHCSELAMFFGNFDKMKVPLTEQNKDEMEKLQTDWLSFIRTGEIPNHEHYSPESKKIIHYDGEPKMIPFPHSGVVKQVSKLDSYEILFKKFFGVED